MSGDRHKAIGEDDIQAFIDGRLDSARAAEVEAWLAAHPAQAQAVEADRRIRQTLRTVAAQQLEPIPAALRLEELRQRRASSKQSFARIAAAVLLIAVGASSGWALRAYWEPPGGAGTMADATAAWRIFANDAVQPVELTADKRVQLAAWIGGHIGRAIDIPDLGGAGLRFLGGRLLSADAGPAGMFLYEDAERQRYIFYVRPTSGERPEGLQIRVRDGVETRFWFDGRHGYALAGPAGSPRLLQAADAVRLAYANSGSRAE